MRPGDMGFSVATYLLSDCRKPTGENRERETKKERRAVYRCIIE